MGALYSVMPHATSAAYAPTEIATGTTAKTLIQVATPSTTNIRIVAWGIGCKGIAPTDAPGTVELFDCAASTPATVTSWTPDKWDSNSAQSSLCVGGTTATGITSTSEGTLTAYRPLDLQEVHPQSGYAVWFPDNRRPIIDASRFVRIRATFAVSISALPWIVWEEPA